MELKKKGVFFTGAAIVLSLVIILSFKVYYGERMRDQTDVVHTRILTMNNFMKDVEDDLKKGIFIAGFRTFLSFQEYIGNTGEFIPDIDSAFEEGFLQGTIEGQTMNLLKDSTFTDWTNRIKLEAEKMDISINFTVNEVEIKQTDPWKIDVEIDLNLLVIDGKKTSKWDRNKILTMQIPIDNFEDPLYTVNSLGRVANAIIKTNLTPFVSGGDMDNFLSHQNKSYYVESGSAPNYLKRLQGDLSNSTTGTESLVNLDAFLNQGLSIDIRSAVDYIYFGPQVTTNYQINNTPSWFYLDEGHLEFYGVVNLTN